MLGPIAAASLLAPNARTPAPTTPARSPRQPAWRIATAGRLRYPKALTDRVARIVRHHMFQVGKGDPLRARRFLAKHGAEVAFELVDHKHADFLAKRDADRAPPLADIDKLLHFRETLEEALSSPHRLADLAVNGDDLIAAGFKPGPELGRVLRELLHAVVEDPARNTRAELLERAIRTLK